LEKRDITFHFQQGKERPRRRIRGKAPLRGNLPFIWDSEPVKGKRTGLSRGRGKGETFFFLYVRERGAV